MDLLRELFRDKSAARLLMIAAIVLLFISQFFLLSERPGRRIHPPKPFPTAKAKGKDTDT